jgi:hypothetical protein
MPTSVVNIRHGGKYEVYIGRAGKGQRGDYGNPVCVGKRCPICGGVHAGGGETLPCYTKYLKQRLETDPAFKLQVESLRGKVLACFCHPAPCHGHVLARYLDTGVI